MSKKVRSIKGEVVDFDLIKIKQQIAAKQEPVNVKEREEFIDKKVRRRPKKAKVALTKLDVDVTLDQVDEEVDEADIDIEVEVEPTPEEVFEAVDDSEAVVDQSKEVTPKPVRKK